MGDSSNPAYRTAIVPILGAGQGVGQDILAMWGRATASDARIRLGSDDVQVTNKRDKKTIVPIVERTDEHVREMLLRALDGAYGTVRRRSNLMRAFRRCARARGHAPRARAPSWRRPWSCRSPT